MAKSKKRGGEQAHRKRLQARNQNIKTGIKKQQEMFSKLMEETMKKMKEEQMSGDTSTSQTVNLNTDGFVQSAEIL